MLMAITRNVLILYALITIAMRARNWPFYGAFLTPFNAPAR